MGNTVAGKPGGSGMLKVLDHLEEWLLAPHGGPPGLHVGVDVVVNHLPEGARRKCILFSLFAGALFTGVVAAFGANFVWQLTHTSQRSPDMEVPMWIVYLAIPL